MERLVDQAAAQARAMADAEARGEQVGPAPRIQIQPVPTMVGLGQAELPTQVPDPDNEGETKASIVHFLVLSFSTPSGEQHYFLQPGQAKNLAEAMNEAATMSESGMWLPGQRGN